MFLHNNKVEQCLVGSPAFLGAPEEVSSLPFRFIQRGGGKGREEGFHQSFPFEGRERGLLHHYTHTTYACVRQDSVTFLVAMTQYRVIEQKKYNM